MTTHRQPTYSLRGDKLHFKDSKMNGTYVQVDVNKHSQRVGMSHYFVRLKPYYLVYKLHSYLSTRVHIRNFLLVLI